jgi:hypothetical protein
MRHFYRILNCLFGLDRPLKLTYQQPLYQDFAVLRTQKAGLNRQNKTLRFLMNTAFHAEFLRTMIRQILDPIPGRLFNEFSLI